MDNHPTEINQAKAAEIPASPAANPPYRFDRGRGNV